MPKTKRGQLSTVFVYLFAIIVIALILIMGYNFITTTKENVEKTDLILLKNKLISDIKAISSDYGSSKKVTYSLPESAELCLFDLDKKDEILDNLPANFNSIIKDSIRSDVKKNAFIISSSIFESIYIGNIEINNPYFNCIKPLAGKISFVIEGAGNRTLILTNP